VLRLLTSADIAFVNFDDTRQFGGVVAASLAEALQHKPCCLLGDADLRVQLQAADAFTGRYKQIHRIKPLVQRHFRSLKNGAGANRKHNKIGIAAIKAGALYVFPDASALAAGGADRTFRPPLPFKIDPRCLIVGEPLKQFERADAGLAHENVLSGGGFLQSHYVAIGPAISDGAGMFVHPGLCRSGAKAGGLRLKPVHQHLVIMLLVDEDARPVRTNAIIETHDAFLVYADRNLATLALNAERNGQATLCPARHIMERPCCDFSHDGIAGFGVADKVGHYLAFLTGRVARLPPDKSITIRHIKVRQQKSLLTYIIPFQSTLIPRKPC